jgi:hypothetical protein
LWELASFHNFYKSRHTQGIHVFRAPLIGNHHTLQGDAESGHGPGKWRQRKEQEIRLAGDR